MVVPTWGKRLCRVGVLSLVMAGNLQRVTDGF